MTNDIQNQMDAIIETGDYRALEDFALDHFAELPEDMQKALALDIFSDAMQRRAADAGIARIQRDGLDAIEKIAAFRAALTE